MKYDETETKHQFLSISDAKNHINPLNKEKWLNDEDFFKVFGMNKEEFYEMAPWKQNNLKKSKGFF